MLATDPSSTTTPQPDPVTASAAVGSAVVGGVFAAFSTIVMPAVTRLSTERAVSTMQSINRAAVKPPFMVPFLGTTALSGLLGIRSLRRGDLLAGLGSACYLAGFVLTAAYHVPRNERLQTMSADSPAAAAYWNANIDGWNRMNHVRAALALAAALAFGLSSRRG